MLSEVAAKIARLKNQTIGVEVEMNNITREEAAKLAAEFFGTGRYEFTHYRNGYSTWSAWDDQGREWKFQKDSSIRGLEDEKCELVTPILYYYDIEKFLDLLRVLRKAGAKSSPSRGCGVHIHIGLGEHTPQTLRNLANFMASHEESIGRAIRIDDYRTAKYCRTVDLDFLNRLNAEKPKTMDELANVWYEGNGASDFRNEHYNPSRYHMLNLHASFTKGTIEFRMFQFDEPTKGKKGGIHCGQLKAYIQLCLAMSQYAKDAKHIITRKPQTENEKYVMRSWLMRIGFIGDEFKTARELLLKNVEGNLTRRY